MVLEEKLNGACPVAIDLVRKLIQWNPANRPSAEECLAHPYLVQFHRPKREINAPSLIVMTLPDSQHFTAREYRNQIYKEAVTPPQAKTAKGRKKEHTENT
jgi:mitogen-activated protein kinase 15